MTERCTHCRGTGRITVMSRIYEYPSFDALCYVCNGAGVKASGLDLRGEQEAHERMREAERWSQRYADRWMGEDNPPNFTDWMAEQIHLEQARMAAE